MTAELLLTPGFLDLKYFSVHTLAIQSQSLKGNPLKDPTLRRNPVLIPTNLQADEKLPLVILLSGFMGNGPNAFNLKTFEMNAPETIDSSYGQQRAPRAVYLFVDAMTAWGGSQFINSEGAGLYEDYIVKELVPAVAAQLPIRGEPKFCAVMGSSSGGYGALHLGSRFPEIFGHVAVSAPDAYFEASLLPDLYVAAPEILKLGGYKQALRAHRQGEFKKGRNGFKVLNALGMASCYSPVDEQGVVQFPIHLETGERNSQVWSAWLKKDPVVFMAERTENLQKLQSLYLDVGRRDEFSLFFGARQLDKILKRLKLEYKYEEFDGGHFDLSTRRPLILQWLNQQWP